MSDLDVIKDLHHQFVIANTHEDTDFLAPHLWPDVSWYNLNKSNYMTDEAILTLWKWLYTQRPDKTKDAPIRAFDEQFLLEGNVAWVVYMIEVHYDFGEVRSSTVPSPDAPRSGRRTARIGSCGISTAPSTSPASWVENEHTNHR